MLIRMFEGTSPDGMKCGMVLTAGRSTPPEALGIMDRLGVKALESKFPGIRDAQAIGDRWEEHEIPEPDFYVRLGWRHIRAGDVIKDPRGNRVIEHADQWGYRLQPDERHPYTWVQNWPRVGRLKVIQP